MIQKPFRGIQLNRTHPLAKGLVGCWVFNEATGETVFDLSGNGNNGTLENDVTWGGNGLDYGGVDGYVNIGNNANCNGAGTFIVWIKVNSWSGTVGIAAKGDSANGNNISYGMWGFDTGKPKCYVANGAAHDNIEFNTVVTTNVWHQLAYTWDGSNLTTYLDGIFDKQESQDVSQTANTRDLLLGAIYTGGWFFPGYMASVSLYNYSKSLEEIAWLYREPYAMFEPAFNPALLYSAAPPVGAIMNQFQKANIGADLYNGVFA